jgi:hypothetical protein
MKRLFSLLVLGVAVFAWIYRQRIFVRDPLGVMEKNGGKQGWSGVAGVPERLSCLQRLVCMTASDHAGVTAVDSRAEMSRQLVTFVDGDGVAVRVTLR